VGDTPSLAGFAQPVRQSFRGYRSGSQRNEGGVVLAFQGEEGLIPSNDCLTKALGFTSRRGIGHEDVISQGGDKLVSFLRQFRGGVTVLFLKRGDYQQAALVQGQLPLSRETGPYTPGRADDNRLVPPEQELEAFFFHGGMKAADDRNLGFAQGPGQVIGFQDKVPGAFDRTEPSKGGASQDSEVAKDGKRAWGAFTEITGEAVGEVRMVVGEALHLHN
jgi:hypothetical protein